MDQVTLYIAGKYNSQSQVGAWASLLLWKGESKELSGVSQKTTPNRMKLIAVAQGLKVLKRPCEVTLYTDSEYIFKGLSYWWKQWVLNGWKTIERKPVANKSLWEKILNLNKVHTVKVFYLKKYTKDTYKEKVETLCASAFDTYR